jgi:lysophospholipase L1-like esterase
MGLPNPQGGGYRKPLQDMLRAAAIRYEFVGQLTFGAYGKDGVVDPDFSPNHQGLPGFGCVQESGITDDGVHPNAEGQKAIATAFFGVLEPTLRNLKLK